MGRAMGEDAVVANAPAPNPAAEHTWKMFQTVRALAPGNIVLCPHGCRRMGELLAEGANGPTQREILTALNLAENPETRRSQAKELGALWAQATAGRGGVLTVKNSLHYSGSVEFSQNFLDLAKRDFGVEPEARPDPNLDGPIRMKLANQIQFAGVWASEFPKENTKPRTFAKADGTRVQLPSMTQLGVFSHAKGQDWQMLEMPFQGGLLAFTCLLPADEAARLRIERELGPATWKAMTDQLGPSAGTFVQIPKISLEATLDLGSLWKIMGIRSAFSLADADLRGIFPKVGGYVTSARHVASVSLHEFGADAESVAEAEIEPFGGASSPGYSGGRIVSFIANRPFFWAIRETKGGNLLFLGRFIGPEGK